MVARKGSRRKRSTKRLTITPALRRLARTDPGFDTFRKFWKVERSIQGKPHSFEEGVKISRAAGRKFRAARDGR